MTDTKDPKKTKASGTYDARTMQYANATLEQIAKMTPAQRAIQMNSASYVKEQKQKAKAEADALAQQRANARAAEAKAKADRKAARISAIRASAAANADTKLTPIKVISFLFLPSSKACIQGFSMTLAAFVQTFTRMLVSVGLLPVEHPAITLSGARGYGLLKVLAEARLNLLPLRAFRETSTTGAAEGIRALAVRQYAAFTASVGMLFAGFISMLYGLSRVILSVAHADTPSSVVTTGTGIGGCPLTSNTAGVSDLASACLDGVFGTGTSGATSLVSVGLGKMLALYSNVILVIAGIMVLWIIVSLVAETARTGVFGGKNFNPVWVPIRLVVALGLLVPLPSGLNSGQYIVVSLAKWGSQEGSTIWNQFTQTMLVPSSGTGSGSGAGGSGTGTQSATSGISAVPFDEAPIRSMAANLFHVALCQQINNALCTNDSCSAIQDNSSQNSQNSSVQVVQIGNSSQQTTPAQSATGLKPLVAQYQTPDAAAGGVNCGSVVIPLPDLSGKSQTAGADATAAQGLMNSNFQNVTAMMSTFQNIGQQVAAKVVPNGQMTTGNVDLSSFYSQYQTAVDAYVSNQRNSLSSTVAIYNSNLGTGLVATTQQYGWMYGPIWLSKVSAENANVLGAARSIPAVTGPTTESITSGSPSLSSDVEEVVNAYDAANFAWNPPATTSSGVTVALSPAQNASSELVADLQALTSAGANNPLSQAGTFGHQLVLDGFLIIEPPDDVACFQVAAGATAPDGCKDTQLLGALQNIENHGSDHRHNVLPSQPNLNAQLGTFDQFTKGSARTIAYPIGMVMISMGWILLLIPFIPMGRFLLGVLQWLMSIFVAVLGMPLSSLMLLNTQGDGFTTQQFMSNLNSVFAVILRPGLMALGVVFSLEAFNTIMQVTNYIFAAAVANMTPASDDSLLTLGIYVVVYTTLVYTLANSAFKLIDLMPNWVMNWIGARVETMTDDFSAVQQQSSGYVQTMAYSARSGGSGDVKGGGATVAGTPQAGLGAGGQGTPAAATPASGNPVKAPTARNTTGQNLGGNSSTP